MSKTLVQIMKRFRKALAKSDDYLSHVRLFASTSIHPFALNNSTPAGRIFMMRCVGNF
jgi:hypothetical protein